MFAYDIIICTLSHHVFVHVAPPQIYIHPLNRTVEINNSSTSIVLTCMAYEATSYHWLKNNNEIQLTTAENMTNNLLLVNILPPDSGHYQCVAENSYGRSVSDYAVLTIEGMYKHNQEPYEL